MDLPLKGLYKSNCICVPSGCNFVMKVRMLTYIYWTVTKHQWRTMGRSEIVNKLCPLVFEVLDRLPSVLERNVAHNIRAKAKYEPTAAVRALRAKKELEDALNSIGMEAQLLSSLELF